MSTNGLFRILAWVLAGCSISAVFADDRGRVALDIDALVRVTGMPNTGTEVYIIPAEGRVEHLTEGFSQFTRELDLQTTYLLSFEREGCLNKQVYIDTHVPQSFMSLSPFEFRFKVTLREQARPGDRYAGPVAFVRFNAGLSDFDYETDYRMMRDSTVFERLELARELGPEHPVLTGRREVHGTGATVEAAQAVVDATFPVVGAPAGEEVKEHAVHSPAAAVEFELPVLAAPDGNKTPISTPLHADRAVADPVKELSAREPKVLRETPPDPLAEGRSEELVVERLRVTTIVRVVLNGVATEYRRVAHYHGGVTYFMNGSPCSEAVYREGTGH